MKLSDAAVVLTMLIAASTASATLTAWGDGDVVVYGDADEGFMPGQEILAVWHKFEAGTHYFRIDLEASPMGPGSLPPGFSGVYGIAIDSLANQGANGFNPLLPYAPDVAGIDYLLDAHYESLSPLPNSLALQFAQYHPWETDAFDFQLLSSVGGAFERSGATMEWSIPDAAIGSPGEAVFGWCAYTLDAGSETAKYDLACSPALIPEPVTLATLGLAVAGLGGYLRRRRRG